MAAEEQTEEKRPWYTHAWVKVLVVFLVGLGLGLGSRDSPEERLERAQQDIAEAVQERQLSLEAERQELFADIDKWADRYDIDAEVLCDDKIEKFAKYDFEWTTGFAERIWSRWQWADVDKKILRYYGDKIKFQNGLGVYGQHYYFCEYDIDAEKIIKVSVHPGRM